ncbi:2Fe-2S iron-sulfur cluster binding domain protein [Mycobacterium kansasii 824]|uniref:2Fe-2S iron-sulfur cluster binding domain protein n=3 Tax=Mycobacterium kansasii TaxID=1768 RepID=A0A1V3XSG5_MYCKA|nr:2Fe-2S iron-sulfur cluster binding domain protein [Mycobacterium kansasii 824]OOK82135.1 2Fe-2S iron-sulfur cluster binding domain protein [Mycobacterium kansasii]OOK84387.1 2Fe-2S iron-sulfur cluster binding domain protein [Mycobacterium kansasii]
MGVLLDPNGRGGSKHVHHELHKGARIQVRGPRNHFPFQRANRYQFIAGGTGITPMLPMIEAAEADGADWHLMYGGRQRSSMAFVDELSKYGERVTIWPLNEQGMPDLASVLGSPRDDTLVYCCGPEGLLSAVEQFCQSWPKDALHIERFAAKPDAHTPSEAALDNFQVLCQRSGITIDVGPGESILESIKAKGVSMLASCMEGICGTCEVAVLEGSPDHRDSVLDDDDLDALGVGAGVQLGVHGQPGPDSGHRNGVDDDLVALKRPPTPVHRDVREQPMLDLVPV